MKRSTFFKLAALLPIWIVGAAFIWMFVGFGLPGLGEYSDGAWSFVNYGLPVLLFGSYVPVAWWLSHREGV